MSQSCLLEITCRFLIEKICFDHIMNPLLTEAGESRLLSIGHVLFLHFMKKDLILLVIIQPPDPICLISDAYVTCLVNAI